MAGLFEDVIGFMLEGLAKAGEKAKAQMEAVSRLRQTGEVDPLLSESMTDVGGLAGVLGPIGRSANPVVNRIQKQIAKAIFRADPEVARLMREVPQSIDIRPIESLPKDLTSEVARRQILEQPEYRSFGISRQFNPGFSEMVINPQVLRGRSPTGQVFKRGGYEEPNLLDTAIHEALHTLTTPGLQELGAPISGRTARTIMPHLRHEGRETVMNYEAINQPRRALGEAFSYLGEVGRPTAAAATPEQRKLYDIMLEMLTKAPFTGR